MKFGLTNKKILEQYDKITTNEWPECLKMKNMLVISKNVIHCLVWFKYKESIQNLVEGILRYIIFYTIKMSKSTN